MLGRARIKQDPPRSNLQGPSELTEPEAQRYDIDMPVLLPTYERWLRAAGRSPRTIALRIYYVSRLARHVHWRHPADISHDDILEWLADSGWAPNTRKSAVASIRGFFEWANEEGHLRRNPAVRLPSVRVPAGIPKPAPSTLVQKAMVQSSERDALMIALAAFAGLRRSEIASLRWSDVQWDGLRIKGKGGRTRSVPLTPQLAERLRRERELRESGRWGNGWRYRIDPLSPFVFPGAHGRDHITGDRVARIIARALDRGWSTHTLRHRFATKAYAVDRDLLTVQQLLGHTSPETTARYTAVPRGAAMRAVQGSISYDDDDWPTAA